MNELRIVLLVLGVAAVAGLYFWEAGRDRRQQRRRTLMGRPAMEPRPGRPPADGDDSAALASGSARSAGRSDRISVSGPDRTPSPEQIIALHVVATGAPFRGEDIVPAAENAGLRYGPMRIFHCHALGGVLHDEPLFSMASMKEPGYIDRDKLDEFETPGLSLFMRLPVAAGDRPVFDLMLRTAEMLAETLGGELCGPDHSTLDQGGLAALRARLSD
jgi:cell division protein ZipA